MAEDQKPRLSATKAEEIFVRELYQQNFFACLFSGMKKKANYRIPTLQVVLDPRTFRHIALEYNPDFLAEDYERDPMTFRFSLAHEGAHIVLRHIPRWHLLLKQKVFSEYHQRLFNIAADLAANCLCLPCVAPRANFRNDYERQNFLDEFRKKHLSNDCFPDKFDLPWGLTFEQYFNELSEKFPTPESLGMKVAVVGGDGEGEGEAQGKSMDELKQEYDLIIVKAPKKKKRDKEENKEEACQQQAKGEADSRKEESEKADKPEEKPEPGPEKKPSKATVVHEHSWMDEPEEEEEGEGSSCHEGDMEWSAPEKMSFELMEASIADFAEQTMDEYERRNGRGTLPGGMRDKIPNVRSIIPSAIPWQSLVKRIMAKHNPQEDREIFTRPNYRLLHLEPQGFFPYPSWMQQPGMKVTVVRDTSGSMGMREMKEILGVIFSYLKAFPASVVHLVDADTRVHKVWQVKAVKDCPDDAYGRGGTDFCQPIEYVEEHIKPDVIFYGTDGYGRAPAKKPKTPIIWCMTRHSHIPAEYGAAVQICTGKILRRR